VSHVSHQVGGTDAQAVTEVDARGGRARVIAPLGWTSRQLPSPLKQALFRAVTGTVGRAAPNMLRAALQRALITGERRAPFTLQREINWSSDPTTVTDTLLASPGAPSLSKLYRSSDATSIYVASSNAAQDGALLPGEDLSEHLPRLRESGSVTIRRELCA
jgi:hypothetical protein